jgi:hypothetical protein
MVKSKLHFPSKPRLLRSLVDTDNHGVVTLEGLEGQLLLGLDAHFPELGDFLGEDGFGGGGRVDTVGLDGDDDTASDLEEETGWEELAMIQSGVIMNTYRSDRQYGPGQVAQRRQRCSRPCRPACGT